MQQLPQRLEALYRLHAYMRTPNPEIDDLLLRAQHTNPWFTKESIQQSISNIASHFLDRNALKSWVEAYPIPTDNRPMQVGIVMAGNIPMVGFHDWLCVFVAGCDCQVKCSSKDPVLLPHFINKMYEMAEDLELPHTHFVRHLKGYDAIIATGSDNTAMHFKHYFRHCPHIVRHNRSSVALLTGEETESDWMGLGHDLFDYYGLGCRNIAHIYVPEGYDFPTLISFLDEHFAWVNEHHKYRNNYDYNLALFLLNNIPHYQGASIVFKRDDHIASRIASVHYSTFNSPAEWPRLLAPWKDKIQLVSSRIAPVLELAPYTSGQARFGKGQAPTLTDYPDGIDTMEHLIQWHEMVKI